MSSKYEGNDLLGRAVSLGPIDGIPEEKFASWQNDRNLRNMTMGFRFPVTICDVRQWAETKAKQNGKTGAAFGIFLDETAVGACFLQDIDWVHRKATIGIYLGEAEVRGQGVALAALNKLISFSFDDINLRRISLTVVSSNLEAIKLYEGAGFFKEGIQREAYYIDGKFLDVFLYSILAREFSEKYYE